MLLEKVIISPMGNQFVMTMDNLQEDYIFDLALFDENGKCLDLITQDWLIYSGGSRNPFEFLGADMNTKKIKFVPVHVKDEEEAVVKQKIGQYPIEFETSEYGKVIVTNIRITDGRIEIDYKKAGFVMFDPGLEPLDENGEPFSDKIARKCFRRNVINYGDNSYTAVLEYFNSADAELYYHLDGSTYDVGTGNEIGELVTADALKNAFYQIGFSRQNIWLDYDNAITVDLK